MARKHNLFVWLSICTAMIGTAAAAEPVAFASASSPQPTIAIAPEIGSLPSRLSAERRLQALREEALAEQAADGGTLTDNHRRHLQHKLDNVMQDYRIAFRR